MSAKDKGTGTEQSMTITGGTSLSQEDIDRMVKDAEANAESDKKRREAADMRNNAEQLAYSTEKLVKDNDEKLSDDVKTEVQADIDAVKTALEGDDDSAVESAVEKLQGSMGKIGEAVYSQDGAEGAAAGEQPAQDEDEDIVDAEVVDDEKDDSSSK